jgi:hypothetical protein
MVLPRRIVAKVLGVIAATLGFGRLSSAQEGEGNRLSQRYEIHTEGFREYLSSLPSGSADTIIVFEPPPVFAISLEIKFAKPVQGATFVTTVRLMNGAEYSQRWHGAATVTKTTFRVVLGVPDRPTTVTTELKR